MSSFYSRLSYSFGNEDWNTEYEALAIQPQDRVLCITASGDRPLNLLLANCAEIISIDTNPIQNHLLSLKKAALNTLPYDEYLAFLGITSCKNRWELFNKIESTLARDSRSYWEMHKKSLEQGILYAGALEKRLKIIAQLFRLLKGKKMNALFATNDLEKQKKQAKFISDSKTLKKLIDVVLHPVITKIFLKDPGLYENLEDTFHVGKYIYKRIHSSLERVPIKENILLSLCFQGKVYEEGFPPYLKKQESSIIKSRLDRIKFKTMDLIRYLESSESERFDCFSLSDVASYMDYASFVKLLQQVLRTAKPNARFCIRQFLTHYSIPKELEPFFERTPLLEHKLEQDDRCLFYRFLVGKVLK